MAKFIKFKNSINSYSIINIDLIASAYYSTTTGRVVITLIGLENNEEKVHCTMENFIKAIESKDFIATIK